MDYSKRGEVKISTEGYLREVLDDFQEEITGRVNVPAATHFFEVRSREGQKLLDKTCARAFSSLCCTIILHIDKMQEGYPDRSSIPHNTVEGNL